MYIYYLYNNNFFKIALHRELIHLSKKIICKLKKIVLCHEMYYYKS